MSDSYMRYVSTPFEFLELDIEPKSSCLCRVVFYIVPRYHIVNFAVHVYPLHLIDLLHIVQSLP